MEKFALALSRGGSQGLADADFEAYAKNGVKALELGFPEDQYDSIPWNDIKTRSERFGVELWSFHLPFSPFETVNLADADRDKRAYSVKYSAELLRQAADVGIRTIVVHPSAEPFRPDERKEAIRLSKDSLAQLADVAGECGATVAVEDLPRTCLGRDSDEILELISADDRLRVCFDTNHLLVEPIRKFILAVGSKIVTTHVSDYDFKNERHWLPGNGKIDWVELVDTLDEVGYCGPLLYEVGAAAPATINQRRLTVEDFRENHRKLVGRLPIEPVGTPIEEKCLPWI